MDRRRLIKLAALSLAGFALPLTRFVQSRVDIREGIDRTFEAIFGDSRLAASIGKAHAAVEPSAAVRGRRLMAALANQPAAKARDQLRRQVERDMAALDVVVVDGWVLARCEADLCAGVHRDRSIA